MATLASAKYSLQLWVLNSERQYTMQIYSLNAVCNVHYGLMCVEIEFNVNANVVRLFRFSRLGKTCASF